MVHLQAQRISTHHKEPEMDVLAYEIEIVQNDLVRVEAYLAGGQLRFELEDIVLEADEAHEVLKLVRTLKQKRLDQLVSLQSEGESA